MSRSVPRDIEILRYIALADSLRVDQIALELTGVSDASAMPIANRIVSRLEERGLVIRHRETYAPAFVFATQAGLDRLGFDHWKAFQPKKLRHFFYTENCRRFLLANNPGATWKWERELRHDPDRGSHWPDGLLQTPPSETSKVMVKAAEIEISLKSNRDWVSIVLNLADRWERNIYFTTDEVARPLRRIIDGLGLEDQFEIHPLPAGPLWLPNERGPF